MHTVLGIEWWKAVGLLSIAGLPHTASWIYPVGPSPETSEWIASPENQHRLRFVVGSGTGMHLLQIHVAPAHRATLSVEGALSALAFMQAEV